MEKTCCFIGHRNVKETPELRENLQRIIENLILKQGVVRFLFGSKSRFDDLCLAVVSQLKEKYHDISRVYVRAEYPVVDKLYENYLLESYEETYMPKGIENAGEACYVERNEKMIDVSDFCVFYYDPYYQPARRKKSKRDLSDYQPKSGTRLAFEYAQQRKRSGKEIQVINVYEETYENK